MQIVGFKLCNSQLHEPQKQGNNWGFFIDRFCVKVNVIFTHRANNNVLHQTNKTHMSNETENDGCNPTMPTLPNIYTSSWTYNVDDLFIKSAFKLRGHFE